MKNYSPDNLQLKQTRAKVMKKIIIAMLVCGFAWQQAQAQSPNQGGAGCELLEILLGITVPGCSTTIIDPLPGGTFPPPVSADACPGHPGVRPRPAAPGVITTSDDGMTTTIDTPESFFAPSSADDVIPSNLCPTVYELARTTGGNDIPNSLPSTPEDPYNLHPDPVVSEINPLSPTDDLRGILKNMQVAIADGAAVSAEDIQFGLDILEGNDIDRAYSGMPMLHYNGPNKVRSPDDFELEFDADGNVTGGRIEVHQVWFDQRIMADTSYIDPTPVLDVPWTMVVHADTLNRGHEDFAPFTMYFDDPAELGAPAPHVGMDMTFFPMEDGTRTTFEMQMPPGRMWNLTYFWGWRIHPPRVQVIENGLIPAGGVPRPEWESIVFGPEPTANEDNKLAAIAMIGDLAPAKRMWNILRSMRDAPDAVSADQVAAFESAFDDWVSKIRLPSGIQQDPEADMTVLFANNTMYGDIKGSFRNNEKKVPFRKRGDQIKVKLLNADHFVHAYQMVDFGGMRGWENTFQNTIPIGGAGPWFTFGRVHWWPQVPMPPMVPPAPLPDGSPGMSIEETLAILGGPGRSENLPVLNAKGEAQNYHLTPSWLDVRNTTTRKTPDASLLRAASAQALGMKAGKLTEDGTLDEIGVHNVIINFNYEPSQRITMYQFDPLHHDMNIWSVH
jgi:hypothetical protein